MSTQSTPPDQEFLEADLDVDDGTLVREYDVGDGVAESIFGALDTGGFEDEDEDEESWRTLRMTLETMRFQRSVRVSAARRTEANRRAGGKKTQKSVVKSWFISFPERCSGGRKDPR